MIYSSSDFEVWQILSKEESKKLCSNLSIVSVKSGVFSMGFKMTPNGLYYVPPENTHDIIVTTRGTSTKFNFKNDGPRIIARMYDCNVIDVVSKDLVVSYQGGDAAEIKFIFHCAGILIRGVYVDIKTDTALSEADLISMLEKEV